MRTLFRFRENYNTEGESWIHGESPKTRSLRRKAVRSTTPAGFEHDRHPRRGAAVPIDNPTLLSSLSFLSIFHTLSNSSFRNTRARLCQANWQYSVTTTIPEIRRHFSP
jgi:hypothetical protein